jgi:hypothetical protein
MAFSKSSLKAAIKSTLLDLRNNTDDPDTAADALAQTIADNIGTQLTAMFTDAVITNVPVLASPSGPVTGTITTTITIIVT